MPLTPLLTSTPGNPPSYNLGMAETFSYVPVEGAGRPLFAQATYIVNTSQLATYAQQNIYTQQFIWSDISIGDSTHNLAKPSTSLVRVSLSANSTITGLVSGNDGELITFVNATPGFNLTFAREDTNSNSSNRFIPPGTTGDLIILSNEAATAIYDSVAQRWRIF